MSLSVNLGKLKLRTPLMLASGTWGLGENLDKFFALKEIKENIGALVTKGISVNPRKGNPPPRTFETPCGLINSIGIENPGIKEFKRNYFIGDIAKFKSLSSKLFFKGHPIPLSQEEENGALILKAPPFANTGFYTVKTKDGEKVIAVNLRRGSENNLERLSDSEIKKIFDDAGIFKIKNPADEIPVILSGKPVGKYIIILILLFLIAEVILANKL